MSSLSGSEELMAASKDLVRKKIKSALEKFYVHFSVECKQQMKEMSLTCRSPDGQPARIPCCSKLPSPGGEGGGDGVAAVDDDGAVVIVFFVVAVVVLMMLLMVLLLLLLLLLLVVVVMMLLTVRCCLCCCFCRCC